MRRSLLRLYSYFSFMDYRNANYRNVGYDKKIIFIAKVGSKTMLKSEVCAIDWHIKTSKPRRSRGLWSQNWLRKRVLSAAQGAPKNGTPQTRWIQLIIKNARRQRRRNFLRSLHSRRYRSRESHSHRCSLRTNYGWFLHQPSEDR